MLRLEKVKPFKQPMAATYLTGAGAGLCEATLQSGAGIDNGCILASEMSKPISLYVNAQHTYSQNDVQMDEAAARLANSSWGVAASDSMQSTCGSVGRRSAGCHNPVTPKNAQVARRDTAHAAQPDQADRPAVRRQLRLKFTLWQVFWRRVRLIHS